MNKKIIFATLAILIGSLILVPLENSDAATYTGSDGSVSKYLTKTLVKQYKKDSPYWSYIVKACATDYPLAIATVDLKSDVEQVTLGVNSVIQKGHCSYFGAVMRANNGNTLGATMTLKSDAANELQSILAKLPTTTQKEPLIKRILELYNMLGYIPKF